LTEALVCRKLGLSPIPVAKELGVTARQAIGVLGCALMLVLVAPASAPAERDHFQVKLDAVYEEGDFGTSETTRLLTVPLTLRYLGERFDFGVTGFLVYLDAPRQVTLVEGDPSVTRDDGGRHTELGPGDTILKLRVFALDDLGPDSWLPSLTPFVKFKIPTGDEKRELGTGKPDGGLGVEFDKQFASFFILGDVSYTFIGDPPGENFRDRPAASLGAGVPLGPKFTFTALLDWRRALVRGNDDALEVHGILSARLAPALTVSPYAFMGLTDGTSEWGLGFEASYRFGRW
jgi:hypothetical protein